MAAAVVPSRARAAARPQPPDSAVTYVRLTLVVDTLSAHTLAPPPAAHLLRWRRAGRLVKSTAARPVPPGSPAPFAEKMALYARVKRAGPSFVPEDPAEPLQTQLELCEARPGREPHLVAAAAFDLAQLLHTLVQAGDKTLCAELPFPPHATATYTLTVKVLGENQLAPYVAPPDPRPPVAAAAAAAAAPSTADPNEVATALELEKLRQDVREREGRLAALEDSSARLDAAVHEHARAADAAVPPGDVAALHVRIDTLEQQRLAAERERAEAERKVSAHVAHAARIKSTYNQLAAWYNNLRQEHTELQERLPPSEAGPSDAARDLPQGVATTHEADIHSLERERSELQELLERERSEKKEMHSRNSELLESKARTLAELREQWESAQGTLVATQRVSDEHSRRVKSLEESVDALKLQLAEKDSLVSERSAQLAQKDHALKELESAHVEAISRAREEAARKAKADAEAEAEAEMAGLKRRHQEEAQMVLTRSNVAGQAALEEELAKMRSSHETEIEKIRDEINAEHLAKLQEELAAVRLECEEKLQRSSDSLETSARDAEKAVVAAEERTAAIADEKAALLRRLDTLVKEHEQQVATTLESHQTELEKVARSKDEVDKQLRELNERAETQQEELQQSSSISKERVKELEAQLATAAAELEATRKENEDSSNSPRQIGVEENMATEAVASLEAENAKLRAMLKAESGKRDQAADLLASADDEHDELRAMITRLRAERDEAVGDLKRSREIVPNPHVNLEGKSRRSLSNPQGAEAESLLQERDKAIRELFRVRKVMNKEIKRLKKENQDLSLQVDNQGLSEVTSEQGFATNATSASDLGQEQNAVASELEKLRNDLLLALDGSRGTPNVPDSSQEVIALVRQRIEGLEEEKNSLYSKSEELREDIMVTKEALNRDLSNLSQQRDDLEREVRQARDDFSASSSELRAKEEKIAELSDVVGSVNRQVVELRQGLDMAERERDEEHQKAAALQTELGSLKESLETAASSSSSAETLLRDAQRDVAEGKAKLELLNNEIDELKQAAEKKDIEMRDEIARLETMAEEQALSSRNLSDHPTRTGKSSDEAQARVLPDRVKAKGSSRLGELIQNLQSRNASLTAELASEQSLTENAQKRVSEADAKLSNFETEVRQLQEDCKARSEDAIKLASEKENAVVILAETKKRLEMVEGRLSEQQVELTESREMIKTMESSREFLEKEATQAGGKSIAVTEELLALRAELKQTQGDLENTSRSLREETEKSSNIIKGLEEEKGTLSSQMQTLQLRFESTEDELRVIKESYAKLESVLQKVQEKATRMGKSATEKSKECAELRIVISELKSESQQVRAQYDTLTEQHRQTRDEMASTLKETGVLQSEKRTFSEKIKELEAEIGALQERLAFMQEENEDAKKSERAQAEKELKRSSDMRKELRSARAKAESLEAEVEQLRASNAELLKATKENGDSRDVDVLNDLINTRMALAYAQEETIQLRNRLKKLAQTGQGNSSFGSSSYDY